MSDTMLEAYNYAVRLLHAINERNWPEQEIYPLPDLVGVLTQIDHVTAHMSANPAALHHPSKPDTSETAK
jgi:hypothetical protein